jgi:hypothetical protein
MNPLHSFKARVADGKVYVTASPTRTLKDSVAFFPNIPASFAENSGKGVVIVGGGSGALHTVQSLREVGRADLHQSHRLTVFTRSMDTKGRSLS